MAKTRNVVKSLKRSISKSKNHTHRNNRLDGEMITARDVQTNISPSQNKVMPSKKKAPKKIGSGIRNTVKRILKRSRTSSPNKEEVKGRRPISVSPKLLEHIASRRLRRSLNPSIQDRLTPPEGIKEFYTCTL